MGVVKTCLMGAGGVRGVCHAECGVCALRARREAAEPPREDMGDTYLKQHDAPEDIEYYHCGPPMMAKTVLDLLHSIGGTMPIFVLIILIKS